MNIWDSYAPDQFIGLNPWVWVQLESSEPPGPFPFLGGVDSAVVESLHQVHGTLLSSIETAISDIMAHRAPLDDPALPRRLEDAYAEVVETRPNLKNHIQCGRQPDGSFQWSFPLDPQATGVMSYQGLRIFNAVTRHATPFGFERPIAPLVGKFIGFLDGTHRTEEIRTIATALGRDMERHLTKIFELLKTHDCLAVSPQSSVQAHWLNLTRDQDMIHLGHAALMYRHQNQFFWFDPWLMPWFAESPVPSLWTSLLPRPAAIFLTHDHDDHVDPRTLLHLPKGVPIFVPSRKNRLGLYYDYLSLMRELGFSDVKEMAHGDSWKLGGGEVVSVPFYGEDPCDLALPRNCYLVNDRSYNILVHADSGPTNDGKSAIKSGTIAELVKRYGSITTVFASQQQLKEVRSYAAYACLSHPGKWLEVGENGFLTNQYLAGVCATARAKLFVSYATGGADWYPDHLSFMFSNRNPARTALLTAHWDQPDSLRTSLDPVGCSYHFAHALDIVRHDANGSVRVFSLSKELAPIALFQLDHKLPGFLSRSPGS
jgi:L-ascorbate metabolism protein UlaG (beta-lactamase superfamily)